MCIDFVSGSVDDYLIIGFGSCQIGMFVDEGVDLQALRSAWFSYYPDMSVFKVNCLHDIRSLHGQRYPRNLCLGMKLRRF